jgi:amidohydrolase
LARLVTRTPGGTTHDLHRGDIVIDEAAIPVGARTLAGVVFAAAAQLAGTPTLAGVTPLGAVADR